MRVCPDPERRFKVEVAFELPLEAGDSRPWSASRSLPSVVAGARYCPRPPSTERQNPSQTRTIARGSIKRLTPIGLSTKSLEGRLARPRAKTLTVCSRLALSTRDDSPGKCLRKIPIAVDAYPVISLRCCVPLSKMSAMSCELSGTELAMIVIPSFAVRRIFGPTEAHAFQIPLLPFEDASQPYICIR
jgi:hypothetical protein